MKKQLCLFLFLLISPIVFAQDTLFLRNKETSIVKVKEIGPTEISFIKYDYLDGPIFRINKTDVEKVFFQGGLKEFFSIDTSKIEMAIEVKGLKKDFSKFTYKDGQYDAEMYYRGYKGAGTGSFFAGMFFLYGLPVPIATSLTKPRNAMFYAPDLKLYQTNPQYASGFNERAHRKKAGKAWANYGFGALTIIGIGVAFIFVAIAQLGN
jgi:hypothetical protein